MGEIKSYRDLDVWQLGVELAVDCYALTSRFPAEERFGLTGQARRAAVSIPSNVAEGHNRRSPQSNNAYRNHVSIALGSSGELDTQFEVALRTALCERGGSESHKREAGSCRSDAETTPTKPRDPTATEEMRVEQGAEGPETRPGSAESRAPSPEPRHRTLYWGARQWISSTS